MSYYKVAFYKIISNSFPLEIFTVYDGHTIITCMIHLNNACVLENHQDVLPAVLPFFHIYGLTMIMLRGLSKGCKLVSLPKLESDTFLSMLKNHRVKECRARFL